MLDILIKNGYIITMSGNGVGIIENGSVGIKDNKIEVVGKSYEIEKNHQAKKSIDAKSKAVLPGLVDSHIHTGIGLLRGVAQDISYWLQKGLWPFMDLLTSEEIIKGSKMNIVEGVKSGTTTFGDYDDLMTDIVKNHLEIGTRARLASMINEMPEGHEGLEVGEIYSFDESSGEKKLKENMELIKRWDGKGDGRISCILGPQAPDMLSKELLLKIKDISEEHNKMVHMHVAQGMRETKQMKKRYNERSIPFLEKIGYLDERLIAVHMIEATKEESQLLAKRGANMIACSTSVGLISGSVPPLVDFMEISNNVALGSDETSSNNCCNMFNEMKLTAISNKIKFSDPEILPAWKILRLATIDGARAIGLGDEIGSIEEGKKADLIMVDLKKPNMTPIFTKPVRNIVPNLVYSARGNEVDTVIIDGDIIVENGKLKTVDEANVIRETQEAAENLSDRATEKLDDNDIALSHMMKNDQL